MADSDYPGSTLLVPLSEIAGMPIDQVNFLACEFLALALGYPFRTVLGPQRVSPQTRHMCEAVIGLGMVHFIFGHHALFLLSQSLACYFIFRVAPNHLMPKIVMAVAFLLLCICHLWRQIYHYKSTTTIEISAPLMISTQRLTSLAWSIYDGKVKDTDELTANQRRLSVRKMPSFLEFLSYSFSFHSVLVGPFFFYKDYTDFIDGTNLHNKVSVKDSCNNKMEPYVSQCPSPKARVIRRLMEFLVCVSLALTIIPIFSASHLSEPAFLNSGFFSIMLYLQIFTTTTKSKYYACWKLTEAVNNNAGLGFYYDEKGEPRWDLASGANIFKIEFATSIKMFLDNWNITTTHWLRYSVYERASSMKTLSVFFISCVWHGFYPGYYLTYVSSVLILSVARMVRRRIRPWMVTSDTNHQIYDVITFLATRVAISYMGFPFLNLEFYSSFEVYRRLYFWFHILCLQGFIILTLLPKQDRTKKKTL